MVARNFRSPNHRGEIDLIGWHNDTLCFVEVKTRTTHEVKPAEAVVDREETPRAPCRCSRIPATPASFLPVASRSHKRLLRPAIETAADRTVPERSYLGVK